MSNRKSGGSFNAFRKGEVASVDVERGRRISADERGDSGKGTLCKGFEFDCRLNERLGEGEGSDGALSSTLVAWEAWAAAAT